MFHQHARAVGCYSSDPLAAGTKSRRGFYRADVTNVKLELASLAVIRRIRGREGGQSPDRGELGRERKGGRGRGLGGRNLVGGGRR